MRCFAILTTAGVLISAGANAAEPNPAAKAALTNLQRIVVKKEASSELEQKKLEGLRKLGFESKEDVLNAALADPVLVYMVRLDKLRAYRPGYDQPTGLLTAVDARIYPLRVNRVAKASVFMDRDKLTGYGSPNLTRQLELTRSQLVEKTRLAENAFFLVRVPALNVYFLGYYAASKSLGLRSVRLQPSVKTSYTAAVLTDRRSLVSRPELVTRPTLIRAQRLILTPLADYKLPSGDRDGGFASFTQGKSLDADAVFRTLLQPARNLDVTVPR